MKHIQESIIGRKGFSGVSVEGVNLIGLRPIRLSYYSMIEGGNIIIISYDNNIIIPYMSTGTEDIWGDAWTINRYSLGDGYYMVAPDIHSNDPYKRVRIRPCDDFKKDFPESSDRYRSSGTVLHILKPYQRDIFNEMLHGGSRTNEIFKEFYKETGLDEYIAKLY